MKKMAMSKWNKKKEINKTKTSIWKNYRKSSQKVNNQIKIGYMESIKINFA